MAEEKARKKKKRFKHKKLVVLLLIAVVLIVVLRSCARRSAANAYIREEAAYRDIRTYHSFTGTVEPVTEQNVIAELSGIRIREVVAEEGDTVRKGDPILYLDPDSIEKNIESLQTQMTVAANSANASVQQAWTNYSSYKSDLENGLVSSIVQAQQSIDAAITQYENAQRNYVAAVTNHNNTQADTIRQAQASVDSAYQQVRQAQIALDNADHAKREGANAMNDQTTLDNAYEQAEHSLESAWISYNNAVGALESAKREDDSYLNTYSDALVSAETAYLNAVDSKAIAERMAQETLESYRLAYQQSLLGTDSSVNDLQLARYYEQLEDCVVTAPMDGVITSLSAKEGDMTAAAVPVAVVTSFDEMKIRIKINEYDIMGASVGDPVEITLNAIHKDYSGRIAQISRVATASGGVSYFDSEVEFRADADVRSGMSVEVRLIINDLHDVLTVPSRAVSTRNDGTAYVTVMSEDGKTQEQRDVTCGVTDGTYIEITSGLEAGEAVYYLPLSIEELQMQMMREYN